MIRIPALSLPIGAYEATGLLKVGGIVEVLLATLNFSFHAPTSQGPLTQVVLSFFVSALIGELFVFVVPPHLLELLLFQVRCRVVRIVVRCTFKFVRRRKLNLLVRCVELFEWRLVRCTFCLAENSSSL